MSRKINSADLAVRIVKAEHNIETFRAKATAAGAEAAELLKLAVSSGEEVARDRLAKLRRAEADALAEVELARAEIPVIEDALKQAARDELVADLKASRAADLKLQARRAEVLQELAPVLGQAFALHCSAFGEPDQGSIEGALDVFFAGHFGDAANVEVTSGAADLRELFRKGEGARRKSLGQTSLAEEMETLSAPFVRAGLCKPAELHKDIDESKITAAAESRGERALAAARAKAAEK